MTLNKKELNRLIVIHQLTQKALTTREAAELLDMSQRQVYRLKSRVLKEGESGIIHRNKGRQPAHALPQSLRERILSLHQSNRYKGSNDHHFSELLAEHEGIQVSPSSVRRIRCAAHLPAARKRRPPKIHRSRPRRSQPGMLIQMDASDHQWLEDRAGRFTLTAAIDDATGEVVGGLFRPTEDLKGYFLVVQQLIEAKGIPQAIYTDRHTIFRSPKEELSIEQELAGEQKPLSQFGQAAAELGMAHPKARSPQAKGRIERLFGTFQDRLIVELRLREVHTIEEANRVLPELISKHNARFQVEPHDSDEAYRSLQDKDLNAILCPRDKRCIQPGQTITFYGKSYQIASTDLPAIPVKTKVEVRKTLGGNLLLAYRGRFFPLKELAPPQRQMDRAV